MAKAYVKHDYAVTGRDYVETEGGGSGGGGVNYSTDEQDTGLTWIDGSKIYQKTIVYDGTMNTSLNISHGIENFGELVAIKGGALTRSGIGYKPFSGSAIVSGNTLSAGYSCNISTVTTTAVSVEIGSDIISGVSKLHLTLLYTKTE